ncbi:MAG TPA: UDP-N-acetylmuramoyl-L-alanyl-D-glutamate--2,6-diaminopimelate ligase [Rhizomicrobium sp.]|nr:UDP-N-acetylmuramoyl-L-alanyl-D-glutamate--2,6-diaminopimelate ligase [Rhizomicrobium sp.]
MGPHSGVILTLGKVSARPVNTAKGFSGLASDSREVKPGYLFAALPGTRANGARYIADAVARGAVAVLGTPQIREEAEAFGVRFIADKNPRARLARMAAELFALQPKTIAAVTGTNGKTSVAVFLRQIWDAAGFKSASLGTIGVVTREGTRSLAHTTPDPIEMHRILAELAKSGIDHLALEASSHGLDQYRLDGADVAAAAFTNITRDHLDYHRDFDGYLTAKLRLFGEVVREGGAAVVNVDAASADTFVAVARRRKLKLLTVGIAGEGIGLAKRIPNAHGQTLEVSCAGQSYAIDLPLAGEFQASNALVAAGLAIALGQSPVGVFASLRHLKGAPGRLEKVAFAASGAPIYVDYAHTPDALETILKALRPHVAQRLIVIFGCGGDRDTGKRPLMGKIAAQHADLVIVSDDNPRTEDATAIRKAILAGVPQAREISDRALAIREGIAALGKDDCLVIAGKGHETGQIVGDQTRPFSDREEAIKAAVAEGGRPGEPSA